MTTPAPGGALAVMREEMRRELTGSILPYWSTRAADERHGGVVGLVDAAGVRHLDAPKGAVVHARALWAHAAAHGALGDAASRARADALADFLASRFLDPADGGAYWMIEADGRVRDGRKHVYAQAFAIYAFARHAAAGGAGSFDRACDLFQLVERYAHDDARGGYAEAFARDWTPLDDVRLGPEDADEPRSTNTHLHLLEAYAELARAWPGARPDPLLMRRLRELVELFLDRIVDAGSGSARQFFDADWTPRSGAVSYGHDIETAWLLADAAGALGDPALLTRARTTAAVMAERVLADALDREHGGIAYERRPDGSADDTKVWWPQAEAIVGFLDAYEATGRERLAWAAVRTWEFARDHLVDPMGGEWFWSVSRDGRVKSGREKVGPWKCPYHTARACLEVMQRVAALPAAVGAAS